MQITKTLSLSVKLDNPSETNQEAPIKVTEYLKDAVQELISAKTRCVCVHNCIDDYKYSTASVNYTKISPVDVSGYVSSIDWDTMEIVFNMDDKYAEEDGPHYISEEEWETYRLIVRGRCYFEYEKLSSGQNKELATVAQLFGFDLVKIETAEEEAQ